MDFPEYLSEQNRRQEMADSLYPKLVKVAKRMRLHRLTYRCRNRSRCELLDAIETPEGIVLHQKRYKKSDELNASTSSADGRRVNTYDGDNHWKSFTYFLSSSVLARPDPKASLDVQCDHTIERLTPAEFSADWDSKVSEITLPRVANG